MFTLPTLSGSHLRLFILSLAHTQIYGGSNFPISRFPQFKLILISEMLCSQLTPTHLNLFPHLQCIWRLQGCQ